MYGFNHRQTREYTCMLQDMMEQGMIDAQSVADMCLAYMSEAEVKDMCRSNDILPDGEDIDDDSYDEYDGQPDEAQEWADFDPDC